MMEKIRSISTSSNSNIFSVSESNKNIQIWDVENGFLEKLATDLDGVTESPISISADGRQLAVVGYDLNTVSLYDTERNIIIWQQNGFQNPVNISILSQHSDIVFLETETQGSFFLNRKTGNLIAKLGDIEFIKESPYSNIDHYKRRSASEIVNRADGTIATSFKHMSFAMLDSCFTRDSIICAYSGNPLSAISLKSYHVLWTSSVVGHFLKVEYSEQLDKILGIRWEYEKGSPKYLSYINTDTGIIEREVDLGNPIEISFLKRGSLILTSQGKLYSAANGQVLRQFDFERG